MARQKRTTIKNGFYHILLRGNNKNLIFNLEKDKFKFYFFLEQNKKLFNIILYHFVFMNNHIHFILNAPDGKSLYAFIKRLNIQYVTYYRKSYGGVGHFFQDRYKSFLIQEGRYLLECGRYIELNPVRAGMVDMPEQYKWSSYTAYVSNFDNNIVSYNPEYLALAENNLIRQKIYKEYIKDGIKQKIDLNKYYSTGVYGTEKYKNKLRAKGILGKEKKIGRPKKSEPSPLYLIMTL